MVKDIAFFAYSVRDVPRARAFYSETLGLQPGDSFGDHWIEFNVGNVTFGIGNGEPLGFEPGSSTGAAFEVDDMSSDARTAQSQRSRSRRRARVPGMHNVLCTAIPKAIGSRSISAGRPA